MGVAILGFHHRANAKKEGDLEILRHNFHGGCGKFEAAVQTRRPTPLTLSRHGVGCEALVHHLHKLEGLRGNAHGEVQGIDDVGAIGVVLAQGFIRLEIDPRGLRG